jgi:hypothetical protein
VLGSAASLHERWSRRSRRPKLLRKGPTQLESRIYAVCGLDLGKRDGTPVVQRERVAMIPARWGDVVG